ncbi:dehydratase [Lithospermum erythrorhizon]|uniref:Dihydroflavonol 4-reductase n=1 Tax=Lithospermum erythrorhizon TaxID=34254 RepID=A0AAV3NZU7_LITER
MEEGEGGSKSGEKITYCVTGATGYIGSWLVRSILHRGYRIHATFRDPAKSLHLIKMLGDYDQLRLFKADLQEEGSFDEAVQGCNGVFHVAASMDFNVPLSDDLDNYVHKEVIDPAIRGTLNVLKACSKSDSVKRVVFTSSISTMTAKENTGNWKPVVDESCKTPIDHVWNTKASGWVYVLSKLLTEEAAIKFAKENGINLVSVITTTVGGPFLTPSVPSSIQVLLSPITGNSEFLRILDSVNSRMGSIALLHIEDICSAHIFLMEHPRAEGPYICSTQSVLISELINHLIQESPCSNNIYRLSEEYDSVPSMISSKKLEDLGFACKYGVGDIIKHTVQNCIECGFLALIENQ